MEIVIPTQWTKTGHSPRFTVYHVHCRLESKQWRVQARYSEILELHERIISVPGVQLSDARFLGKAIWRVWRVSVLKGEAFLNEWQIALEQYLKAAMRNGTAAEMIVDFFVARAYLFLATFRGMPPANAEG